MTTKINPAIVVIGFDRPKSIARLLKSIKKATYPSDDIPLVISIDFAPTNAEVIKIAENFEWVHGPKQVIAHKNNLGLRKHVILCGDLVDTYEHVIILEDDLYVSKNFYFYSIAALDFAKDKDFIGGISLYNHKINVHKGEYFTAYEDGYDNWYFQFASSWGQSWSKMQWNGFKDWYQKNQTLTPSSKIPTNVTNWSDKSWLKYFIVYLIQTNRFFLYPKISLSTNFSDQGTHVGSDSTAYQIELLGAKKEVYQFSNLNESKAVYDAFYENIIACKHIEDRLKQSVTIDLYGAKNIGESKYLLTSSILDYKVVESYGRSLKPAEANIFEETDGNDFFLYDLKEKSKNSSKHRTDSKYRRITYSLKVVSFATSIVLFRVLFLEKCKNALRKFGLLPK